MPEGIFRILKTEGTSIIICIDSEQLFLKGNFLTHVKTHQE